MLNTDGMKARQLVTATDSDPLLANVPLALRTIYFPLGFPLEVASNSPAIMEAASQSWERFQFKFALPPLMLRIGVSDDPDDTELPSAPIYRLQWNLLSNIADSRNFVVSDLKEGRSFGWVTKSTADSPLYLRYYLLEAAALSMIVSLRAAPLHAACVSLQDRGMLLCGDSGAGKSSLAFACARAGWTYTSDDSSYVPLNRNDRLVVGNSHHIRFRPSGAEIFPELEGRTATPRAAGKPAIEIPTAEFPEFVTANSATVEYIVFLNRRDSESPQLLPLSREWLRKWFGQSLITAVESYSAQESAIGRLLQTETFELRYKDLDWAVERLQKLAITGR
jgi:hypothetical protein